MKTLRKSRRGLTFSLKNSLFHIGEKYRYVVDKKSKSVLIFSDKDGNMTVSRKKSGDTFKPLFDIKGSQRIGFRM